MLFCFSTLAGFARSSLVSDFLFEANLRSRDFQCCIIVNTDGFSTRRQAKHTVKACHGKPAAAVAVDLLRNGVP